MSAADSGGAVHPASMRARMARLRRVLRGRVGAACEVRDARADAFRAVFDVGFGEAEALLRVERSA